MAQEFSLKPGVTIFYDDVSDLKVIAGQTVEIDEDQATPKTAVAISVGTLVKVKSKSTKKEEKEESK